MALVLLPLCLLALTLILSLRKGTGVFDGTAQALLTMSVLVGLSSELLSLVNRFDSASLSIFWVVVISLSIVAIYRLRSGLSAFASSVWKLIWSNKLLSLGLVAIVAAVFVQGLLYPPNNWDSMTYHLGRVVHWVGNHNIAPYPTHIYRQIWQPPLSELWLAQVCMLQGSDLFANSIQLFFFVGAIACAIGLAKKLKLSKAATALSVVFIATTPEMLLQSSSTQNDVSSAFFVLCVARYCYAVFSSSSYENYLWLALSSGLAFYTKGSTYLFVIPMLGLLFILQLRKKSGPNWVAIVWRLSACMLLACLINIGYYARNMQVSGSPLGRNDAHLFNERFTPSSICIGITQNVALHCAIDPIARPAMQFILDEHKWFDEKIGDPTTNYGGEKFSITHWNHHEDNGSNPLQLLMIELALIILIFRRKRISKEVFLFLSVVVVEFLVFCIALKWQPWNSRLHTPLFLLAAVPSCSVLVDSFKRSAFFNVLSYALTAVCLYIGGKVIVFNQTRPFVRNATTAEIDVHSDRVTKMFINQPEVIREYGYLRRVISRHRDSMAIVMAEDTWEYPLYDDFFATQRRVLPHVNVMNYSRNALQKEVKDSSSIALVIAPGKPDSIVYGGKSFYKVEWYKDYALFARSHMHPDSSRK